MLTGLPASGPGSLKKREDNSLLGTDKEYKLLAPGDKYYQLVRHSCFTDRQDRLRVCVCVCVCA